MRSCSLTSSSESPKCRRVSATTTFPATITGAVAAGDAQIVRINEESARYNIGNIYRNFNTPALALMFLEPEVQPRFKFRRVDSKPPTLASRWNGGVAARS